MSDFVGSPWQEQKLRVVPANRHKAIKGKRFMGEAPKIADGDFGFVFGVIWHLPAI